MGTRWREFLFGPARDIRDPRTFHRISLVALLAWVGLGADGLSSSAYGPDEAFRALGSHTYLAVALALATGLTVLVIAVAYSRIIARFPFGGGGYIVATQLLGPGFGVVSGSALLVDYVLTVAVSIASGADQIFSILPAPLHALKLAVVAAVIGLLVILNLRGVRESVTALAPIFGFFVLTHVILLGGGIGSHLTRVPEVVQQVHTGFTGGLGTLGFFGLLVIFMRAYSMGAGTYTGIEAVSNGLQIMREPKVRTAQMTMTYMSVSLAVTAAGIFVCYLLFAVAPEPGKTLNAVLLQRFAGGWQPPFGHTFVALTLAAEAALLFVAAQTGFIDGPRVMANMAHDYWLPRRFSQLSSRLTTQNGVLLMGGAAIAVLLYTRGSVDMLVTMYAINVFITFSLSQLGMLRYWKAHAGPGRKRGFAIHGTAFIMCATILAGTVILKGAHGGGITLLVTGALVALCFAIRRHYDRVRDALRELDLILPDPPDEVQVLAPIDKHKRTGVLLVGSYGGLGLHSLFDMRRLLPDLEQVIFVSAAVIDSVAMKGVEEVDAARLHTQRTLERYVEFARQHGIVADYRMAVGTDAADELEELCRGLTEEFGSRRRLVFFASKLVFAKERWYQKILHNETAFEIQRRLQFAGFYTLVLPVRVFEPNSPAAEEL